VENEKLEKRWGHFRELVAHMFLEPVHPCPEEDVAWYPATDVFQTEDELVVRMEMGGLRREDIRLMLEGDVLEVRGHRNDPYPAHRKRFHKMEISQGPFLRRLRIPDEFGPGEPKASYQDGVLEIRFARRRRKRTDVQIRIS
jgi:HSP20 family protein